MGLLDDAIREHLELKRLRGADPTEVARQEREALGPARRVADAQEEEGADERAGEGQHDRASEVEHLEPEAPGPVTGEVADVEPEAGQGASGGAVSAGLQGAGGAEAGEVEPDVAATAADPAPSEPERFVPPPAAVDELGAPLSPEAAGLPGEPAARPGPASPEDAELPPTVPPAGGGDPGRPPAVPERLEASEGAERVEDEDVLDQTPDFLEETPEHDRLWFEQRPPRDFDFDDR